MQSRGFRLEHAVLLVLAVASIGCGRLRFQVRGGDSPDADAGNVPADGGPDADAGEVPDAAPDALVDASSDDAAQPDADMCDCPCAGDRCESNECVPATGVRSVSLGPEHSLVVTEDGAFYAWGKNTAAELGIGQIGAGTERLVPTRVAPGQSWSTVASGFFHGCAIAADATMWCWGSDTEGRLGVGDGSGRTAPTQISGSGTWVRVSASNVHTCGIQPDRSLWCWGANASGELGLGDRDNRNVPVRVGTDNDWQEVHAASFHTCAVRTNGTLWCWGFNSNGELGLGAAAAGMTFDVPQQVGTETTWSDPSQGVAHYHSCMTRTDQTLWCWGANDSGRTGHGVTAGSITAPMQVTEPAEWLRIATGYDHTCGLATSGLAWCFGSNVGGKLGTNDTTLRTSPVRVLSDTSWANIHSGGGHTCAVTSSGALWCWGLNDFGALGQNDRDARMTPTRVCLPAP